MFREILENDDAVIALVGEGKLSQDDMKRMHAVLHERLEAGSNPGLLVHLEGFDGYEGAAAMLEDFKMDLSHRNDFTRIAVASYGDSQRAANVCRHRQPA